MQSEEYDVFISYARAEWRHATDVDAALRAKGLKSFFDRRNLPLACRGCGHWKKL